MGSKFSTAANLWIGPALLQLLSNIMLPPMKSMKASGKKAMSKGAMTKALATQHELKQKACSEVINSLVAIATAEVKKNGVFTIGALPPEDKDKASYESRCEDHVRQRDQGEGKASKDHREGLPSARIEEADLDCCTTALF